MKFHLKLGKKDADIVGWAKYLPDQTFSNYVKMILLAEKNKTHAVVPVPPSKTLLEVKVDTAIRISDKSLIQFVRSFSKEGMATAAKRIIRKHIEWNYAHQSEQEELHSALSNDEKPTLVAEKQPELKNTFDSQQGSISKDDSEVVRHDDMEDDDEMSEEYMEMLKKLSGE